ncbi:MAG: hypothetical protein OEM40_10030 [Acidimicrobiia bacterium]|nr:hypothetical protein [Acidimicrobiia bacterium]
MSLKCPTCGATNADSAIWCNQCYASFAEAKTEVEAEVEALPAVTDLAPAQPQRSSDAGGSVATRQLPDPTGAGWTCRSCDSPNPLDSNECTVCGASIYSTFGAEEKERPDVEPRSVLLWALFLPGMGHAKTGNGLLGLTLAALIVFSGIAAVSFASGSQVAAATVFGVAHLGIWAVSVVDALSLAHGNQPILYGRRITVVAGTLVFVIIVQVITQLGGSA